MYRPSLLWSLDHYAEQVLPIFTSGFYASLASSATGERQIWQKFKEFVSQNPRCFDSQAYEPGHCTGSALVVNSDCRKVVLTLHGKLHKWLQLGGHAQGLEPLQAVAQREAEEEAGLKQLKPLLLSPRLAEEGVLPFDLDIHEIPPFKEKPGHLHFDARYLFVASDEELVLSDESVDLRWFSWEEAKALCQEESMQRQFAKVLYLREKSLLCLPS